MKLAILYFLLVVRIFACSEPNPDQNKLMNSNIEILKNTLNYHRMALAKEYRNHPDPLSQLAYINCEIIYKQCDSAITLLTELKLNKNKSQKTKAVQLIFENFNKKTAQAQEFLKTISNKNDFTQNSITILYDVEDQNIIHLLIYSIYCISTMKSFIGPFCGISDDFDLEIRMENKTYRIGDTIRLLSFFNRYDYHNDGDRKLFIEQPTLIKEIRHNELILKSPNLKNRFDNSYIEFIPIDTGKYSLTLSKTIELVNRKIETYESKVEFTVLPK